jgi:hypothetical protein
VNKYSLSHLSDARLLCGLKDLVARDRITTAELLAHIAEVDARKLYLPAACPSMYAYCVQELHLSEDAAYKRIQAARSARQFPAIFKAVADGRLHLSAVVMLGPCLTPENAAELLAAAALKPKAEIEAFLARRFPRSELLPMVERFPTEPRVGSGQTNEALSAPLTSTGCLDSGIDSSSTGLSLELAPGRVGSRAPRSKVEPQAHDRYAFHLTMDQHTYDRFRYAQALLGHQAPSGEIGEVFERALDALIDRLERRKFAATNRPGPRRPHPSSNPRHIPAEVRRAVWERDQGQCTFVSDVGKRCSSRTRLEFDHIEPLARGGEASVSGIRLRCRAHNQYEADRTFGAAYMARKREVAQAVARERAIASEGSAAVAADVRAAPEARGRAAAEARAQAEAQERAALAAAEVIPWLRQLGFRTDEARRGAERCESMADKPLEQRVRAALASLARPSTHRPARIAPN